MLDEPETWRSIRELGEIFGHEQLFIQILGDDEIELNLDGVTTVRDPENHKERTIRARSVKELYQANLNEYLKQLEEAVTGRHSGRELFSMTRPVQDVLRAYLGKRSRL
jgi:hypothetical protein